MMVKKVTYFGEFDYLNSCFRVPRGINSRFCSKTQWQMFLLVSGRHVGAHTDGYQHGVSIQISIDLGKKISPHISHKKNCCDKNFGESLCIFTFFHFPDSGLYLLNGFDFYFDLFWIAWHWKPAIQWKTSWKSKVKFEIRTSIWKHSILSLPPQARILCTTVAGMNANTNLQKLAVRKTVRNYILGTLRYATARCYYGYFGRKGLSW